LSKQDYYELLGVGKDADEATLKKAYRKLAMQYHPDRNPGDAVAEQKFKELGEAYDVLKNPDKRAAYDRYGHAAFEGGGMGGQGQGGAGFDFSDIFEEVFGDFMGSGGRGRRGGGGGGGSRGSDVRINLEISLEDAFKGRQEEVTVPGHVVCESCRGSGAEAGSMPERCDGCNGVGKIRTTQGFFMVERTCPKCRGAGQVITNPCTPCRGAGKVREEKTLQVNIPEGVEDGTPIRLSGEGEPGAAGAPSGDLYIFVSIKPHPLFRRDGEMLFCQIPIPFVTAALGGELEVPTLGGGKARVKVPAGSQSGRQFRLRGKGMPVLRGGYTGDLILETNVETPVNLSRKQKELLREFADQSGDDVNPRSSGFFAKVKDVWEDLTE